MRMRFVVIMSLIKKAGFNLSILIVRVVPLMSSSKDVLLSRLSAL